MLTRVEFSEKQPDYRYMKINDNQADVFIYKYVEEKKNVSEDGTELAPSFIYEFNEFRVDCSKITEEMIKENPMKYLEYPIPKSDISLEERISALEGALIEVSRDLYNG